jgi:hypothetical protein
MDNRSAQTLGTAATAALLAPPYMVPAPLPCDLTPMGVDGRETIYVDPWGLYDAGAITNRNMAFVGHVGKGKSGGIKTFLARSLIPPELLADGTTRLRRAVIIDRKPEYGPLAEFFDCQPIVLGHGVCLNPFDERLTATQQLAVVGQTLELLRGRLEPVEGKCVEVAYRQAVAARFVVVVAGGGGPLLLSDVRYALAHLTADSLAEMDPLPADEVRRTAVKLAFALDELLTGTLAGMFNGPTTSALDWAGQIIDLQVHPDYLVSKRELVYQLVVAIVAVWLDRAWQSTDPHRRVDYLVADEAWDYVKVRQFAALLQDTSKLGRSHRLSVIVSFQGASDAESAGDKDTALRGMAQRLLKDMGIYWLFGQSPEDAELLRGVAQLTDDDIETITNLEAHRYMLVMGTGLRRRRRTATHIINDVEAVLVDSEGL